MGCTAVLKVPAMTGGLPASSTAETPLGRSTLPLLLLLLLLLLLSTPKEGPKPLLAPFGSAHTCA